MEWNIKNAMQKQKLNKVYDRMRQRFSDSQDACIDERRQCLEDRRFYSIAGAQWEGNLGEQFENRPKFEMNKVHLSVIRIINEYRNNRITVDFIAKDGEDSKLSDVCQGLYRADENFSKAQEAYDNAFEEAASGGFGAWRLRTEYEDEFDDENDKQRVKIEPIFDADSCVFFDPNAKRQDKSDAQFAFVLNKMSVEAFEEEYGEDPTSWPKDIETNDFDWVVEDGVYVAEYYEVEEAYEKFHYFEGLTGETEKISEGFDENSKEDYIEAVKELTDMGFREIRSRKIKTRKIHKYLGSGAGILEDLGYIAGKNIPIVPVYGKRWYVDGIERCMGHVRLAKDAQRLKNMQLSKLAEISALSSVEKPILTPEQIAGHQTMWSEDNIKDYPYLLINSITDAEGNMIPSGPIAYTKPSAVPPTMAALLQLSEEDMRDILGNQQVSEDIETRVSGKAVELIQNKLDMQTFIYMSNFSKGMERGGEIWLGMAKEIYVEEGRKMKSVQNDNKTTTIELYKPIIKDGNLEYANDISKADMEVMVDVGPSSSSKRASTVRALTGMRQFTQDPETSVVLESMAMLNMEGEGVSDTREFFRKKLVKMGAIDPTEEDIAEAKAAGDQTTPNDKYLLAAAEEANAKAEKAKADAVETMANAELKKAQAAKIMQEMNIPVDQPGEQAPQEDYQAEELVMKAEQIRRESEFKNSELMIKAKRDAKELELKEREIAIKEQELRLKEQEQALRFMESQKNADEGEEGESEPNVASVISEAMGSLTDAIKSNGEIVKRKKKVIRENGRIVGIETEGSED